jgi:hypothetical protein
MLAALAAPALAPSNGSANERDPDFHGFYLFTFDRYGELTSIAERDLALEELARHKVDRIVVVSYGWANDGELSYGAYQDLLKRLSHGRAQNERVAVIGVGWDSSLTGFRKLMNDFLPLPIVADSIAYLPDGVLFPLSFWSKAAMADRIGYGGLRATLNQLFDYAYPDGKDAPEIYLVGHSFGTRVLSGLMAQELRTIDVRAEPFRARHRVKGAVLFQPALIESNLDEDATYPLLITQSRHDHANGFLFPLANVVPNSFIYTTCEALLQKRVFTAVEGAVRRASDGRVAPPSDAGEAHDAPPEREAPAWEHLPLTSYRDTRRASIELLTFPAAVAGSVVFTPLAYLYAQGHELATRPVSHVLDTLAQLPLVEIPVDALSRLSGRSVAFGERSKGFFELGGLNEAAGRLATPRWALGGRQRVYSMAEMHEAARTQKCGLPVCSGVLLVDASDVVRQGAFGDLGNPWLDYTLGWLDLSGAHADFTNPEVLELGRYVVRPLERAQESADSRP